MADEKVKINDQPEGDDLSQKSSLAIYGVTNSLEKESEEVRKIIRQTMTETSEKYGNRAKGRVVNYFNELNFGTAFTDLIKKPSENREGKSDINPNRAFKKYMSEQDFGSISGILMQESGRIIAYSNYKAIYNHIPECAQALDTYKDNIMSPDDFTKLIFNVRYDNDLDDNTRAKMDKQFNELIAKYGFEELADEIIEGSLLYGDQYVAILSLEEELDTMLSDPLIRGMGSLNEEKVAMFDLSKSDIEITKADIELDRNLTEAFTEALNIQPSDEKGKKKVNNENIIKETIAELINNNVKIGSKKELILERISAEQSKAENMNDIPDIRNGKKKNKKKDDSKPLFINGSSLKVLDPSRVVELKIDNVVYGYYYVQDMSVGNIPNAGYLGQSSGREVQNPTSMGSNIITTNNSKFTPSSPRAMTVGNVSDEKINIISKVFLDTLSKKINKDFVRHNKEFKDFIYNLIRQDYILKKEIKLIYFPPDEVVAFKVPPLYRKIVFFAKLYLAMLTNMLLIKMGRSHDKRVFYIDVGADANYEQAITRVIQDIKTKEFKMDSIGDINTILNLNPGRFDDYYIPSVNGEKPIEIDTLQGMDVDMNNDFLEFLKDSMMSGIGIPRTLIDATKEIDFARTLSAQNANFVRSVIKYQKKLTEPFTKIFRKLYLNEYRFNNDQESDIFSFINLSDIIVEFPSPATLNMSNLTDQIQTVEGNSEFIANTLVSPDPTGLNDAEKLKLKSEIIQDLLPSIDWPKYKKMKEAIKRDLVEDKLDKPANDMSGGEIM